MKSSPKKSIALFALLLGSFTCISAWSESRIVQVHSARLKASPSFVGPSTGSVEYEEVVTLLEEQGTFAKVKSRSAEGWLPKSTLTTRKNFVLRKGNAVQLSRSGSMAAGKGLRKSNKEKAMISMASRNAEMKERKDPGLRLIDQVEAETQEQEGALERFISEGEFTAGRQR
jgi:hypothetical protein